MTATASVIRARCSYKPAGTDGTEALSLTYLHTDKSMVVKLGGGQAIVPPRSIQANICSLTRGNHSEQL